MKVSRRKKVNKARSAELFREQSARTDRKNLQPRGGDKGGPMRGGIRL